MTDPGGAAATTSMAGHTQINARAMNRVVVAVASQALGVGARQVAADIDDDSGSLALTIRSPIRLAALGAITLKPDLVSREGGTILQRAEDAQRTIRSGVEQITGSSISRVEVRVTSAHVQPERRVT